MLGAASSALERQATMAAARARRIWSAFRLSALRSLRSVVLVRLLFMFISVDRYPVIYEARIRTNPAV